MTNKEKNKKIRDYKLLEKSGLVDKGAVRKAIVHIAKER